MCISLKVLIRLENINKLFGSDVIIQKKLLVFRSDMCMYFIIVVSSGVCP